MKPRSPSLFRQVMGRLLRRPAAPTVEPPAAIVEEPAAVVVAPLEEVGDHAPVMLGPKHGIPISDAFAEYVVVLAVGRNVTVYAEKDSEGNPDLKSILTSLERRKSSYQSIAIEYLPLSDINTLRRTHDSSATNTGSGERWVIDILRQCAAFGATDIQFKQYRQSAGIKLRIDGDMIRNVFGVTKTDLLALCTALWNMSDNSSRWGNYSPTASESASIVHKLKQFGLEEQYCAIRLQFNSTFLGPECEVRLQPTGLTARPLASLGLSAPSLHTLRSALLSTGGIGLISGPVGSGKTNLFASTIHDFQERNPGKKIITIEEPVEVLIHEEVSQWVVNSAAEDVAEEYRKLLRRALRSDPQLVMLQECRDATAAAAFMEIGITGAIGLSTIHTPNAMKIIRRLIR